jgi:hypothetical protein
VNGSCNVHAIGGCIVNSIGHDSMQKKWCGCFVNAGRGMNM